MEGSGCVGTDDGYLSSVRRRPLAVAVAALALVAVAVVAILLVRGGGEKKAPARAGDPRAEALAYAPRNATAIIGVDTRSPLAGLVLQELIPRLTGRALSATDVQPLLGNEAVVALLDPSGTRGQLSLVAEDPDTLRALARRLRRTGDYKGAALYSGPQESAIAVRGAAVVAASDEATVRRALDIRDDANAHLTRAEFDTRLAGLPRTAPVRAVFDPRPLVAARIRGALRTRWGQALRNGAAVLLSGDRGLRVPFRLQTDATRLTDADLPLATGPKPPQMRGIAPLLIGVRDLSRLLVFLRKADPQRFASIDRLQTGLPAFLRLDVNGLVGGLTGDATISSFDLLEHVVIRTDPRDPGAFRNPLQRLSTLSGVLRRLGITDLQLIDEPGDAYRLMVDRKMVARAAVLGRTLVATNDPRAGLRAAATAPVVPAPAGAAGALTVRLRGSAVRAFLTTTFGLPPEATVLLDRVGDITGWARAERDALSGEMELALR
ncbi:MAG: hypothetical protein QOH46_804 [Solirubrobacteraceae bacterium]|nr:hypothetical protein [Solirubrobacteraceae bacterium]